MSVPIRTRVPIRTDPQSRRKAASAPSATAPAPSPGRRGRRPANIRPAQDINDIQAGRPAQEDALTESQALPRSSPDALELGLVIVGGCGHVGLPLALSFADAGVKVGVYDTNAEAVATVAAGRMPFLERGAQEILARVLAEGRLELSTDAAILGRTVSVV